MCAIKQICSFKLNFSSQHPAQVAIYQYNFYSHFPLHSSVLYVKISTNQMLLLREMKKNRNYFCATRCVQIFETISLGPEP